MKKLTALLLTLLLLAAACGSDEESAAEEAVEDTSAAEIVPDDPAADDLGSLELEPAEPAPVVELPPEEIAVSLNGVDVTAGELTEFLEAWWSLESTDPSVARNDPFRIEQFIQWELFVASQIEERGPLTDDELAETATSLVDAFPPGDAGTVLLDRITVWQAALDRIARDYFEENPEQFADQLCSSHILSGVPEGTAADDEAAFAEALPLAEEALARFEAGEDFADLARELSTGPTGPNGGDLGCVGPGQFVPEFDEAARAGTIGEAIGPVRSQFGYHVILTREVSFAEVKDAVQQLIGPELELTLNAAVEAGEVDLHPDYGTWDASTATLTPAAS